jgi:phosphatidylserine decarboxylase
VPGTRFAVNRATVLGVEGLFRRNERAVCWFETAAGPLAIVLVGALNVSSISTAALGEIPSGRQGHWQHEPALHVDKGAEIGCFNLGSTVILLFADAAVEWLKGLADGDPVVMGRRIATIRAG